MVTSRKKRVLIVFVAAAAVVAVGLALGAPSAPPVRKAPARKAARDLDCKALHRQLTACSLTIAQAFDPSLKDRLAKHPELLRGALQRTITQEFVDRVANPCFQRKGRVEQGAALQRCLDAAARKAEAATCPTTGDAAKPKGCKLWKQAQQCQALATCLKAKAQALPKPKPTK
ncbi:MAG: hypothetical protein ABI333_22570 [bacterium]